MERIKRICVVDVTLPGGERIFGNEERLVFQTEAETFTMAWDEVFKLSENAAGMTGRIQPLGA